jgi:hypothetical protein
MTATGEGSAARPLVGAFVIGIALAAVILLAASRGNVDRMVRSDGRVYRYVAAHLNQEPEDVVPAVVERGTSLRYGRIGFPVVLWVASAGRLSAMRYAQPLFIVLAAGLAAAGTARLLPQAGRGGGFVPFLAPGFALSIVGGFAEVMAVALALWFLVLARDERWGPAALILGAALLTKETVGVVLAGTAIWLLRKRRWDRLPVLVASVVPVAIWYVYVWSRYGHVPILDPYLDKATDALGTPFVALWDSLTSSPARSVTLALIHLALAIVGLVLWRKGPFGPIAAVAGLQVLAAGPFAWHFTAEATRAFVFLQLFVILALIEVLARRSAPGQTALA